MTVTPVHLRKIKRTTSRGVRFEWHLRYHDSAGRHLCQKLGNCTTMSKREAERARRDFQASLDRKEIPRDRPIALTFTELADKLIEVLRHDLKPGTLYEYELSARLAADALGDTTPVHKITIADVAKLKGQLNGTPATRSKHLSRLRAMLNHAKRHGWVTENPFDNVPMPRFTARSMRIFSPVELRTMIDISRPWWRAFIAVAATTGLRREEVLNLSWDDVDWTNRTISVTAKHRATVTHGEITHDLVPWTPKTYAQRAIPTPPDTLALLHDLRTSADSGYCFLSIDRVHCLLKAHARRTRPRRIDSCNNVLRDFAVIQRHAATALNRSDWTVGTIHDLRRTYGTRMANHVPIHILKNWMGHSDIAITAHYYLSGGTEHEHAARQAMTLRKRG